MVHFSESVDGVGPEQLEGFFAGWPNPPSPETHLRMLRQSSHIVLALEPSGRVVGFIAAISDGVLSAYVSQLEVLSSHRHQGIGTTLLRRLLSQLAGLYSITLHCDLELQPFYAALGMQALGGMALRDYSAQAGGHLS